jgi:hypothetical protein
MAMRWVGWTVTLLLVAGAAGAAAGTTGFKDDFSTADGTGWALLSGSASFHSANDNWAGFLLHWMRLSGENETGVPEDARVLVDPARVNTTWSSYRITAIMERDGASAAGAFGITFGETPGQGHYLAQFHDGGFRLGAPDGATGGTTILLDQAGWGDVPAHVADASKRLRYVLEVEGTVLTVKVNGWPMGTYLLPGTASGVFGFAATSETSIHVQEVTYSFLDRVPPTVEIYRPLDGHYYVEDIPVPIFATGITMATGLLTLGADIWDASGTKDARLYVDGELVPGSRVTDPGAATTWTIDTLHYEAGYHNLSVVAIDHAGNIGVASVEILVVNDLVTSSTVKDVERTISHLLP